MFVKKVKLEKLVIKDNGAEPEGRILTSCM